METLESALGVLDAGAAIDDHGPGAVSPLFQRVGLPIEGFPPKLKPRWDLHF